MIQKGEIGDNYYMETNRGEDDACIANVPKYCITQIDFRQGLNLSLTKKGHIDKCKFANMTLLICFIKLIFFLKIESKFNFSCDFYYFSLKIKLSHNPRAASCKPNPQNNQSLRQRTD